MLVFLYAQVRLDDHKHFRVFKLCFQRRNGTADICSCGVLSRQIPSLVLWQQRFCTIDLTTWAKRILREHYELSRPLQVGLSFLIFFFFTFFDKFDITFVISYCIFSGECYWLRYMECLCIGWDHYQIPCIHACAVLHKKNLRRHQFVVDCVIIL